jgi:heat-inducible transcriptional repressor
MVLDDRKAEVLRALVEYHIRIGEPVSSRAVLESTGLPVSAATIRNDLAALEAEGFVIQPHTSEGRIPTAQAYRYYVDHLTPRKLRRQSLARIHRFFGSVHYELGRLLKETSDLLAEVSHYPAVVVGPGFGGEVLRGVHIVPLGAESALVVLVSDAGRVNQELVRFERPVEAGQIDEAERALTRFLEGKALSDASAAADKAVRELAPEAAQVFRVALFSALAAERVTRDVYVGGTSQMASLWEDLAKVHQILELMEREARLLSLLTAAPRGTAIQIGEELEVPELDVAVVSTDYAAGEGVRGRVGVIGPMRMDYRRAISVVEEVGEVLSGRLGS